MLTDAEVEHATKVIQSSIETIKQLSSDLERAIQVIEFYANTQDRFRGRAAREFLESIGRGNE